jgi:hypothetical protein
MAAGMIWETDETVETGENAGVEQIEFLTGLTGLPFPLSLQRWHFEAGPSNVIAT